ncbi:uncharacterized protein LOC125074112 [Vanessa atalanta]|uniref:uncharacterized protein LOC125074112 n=1 Tax=Vanessa atalanta TaxID=42275 RepID=UPI001FCDEE8D|nr:uncharacterized protein LOC125074112 [Vanessa atalanta]
MEGDGESVVAVVRGSALTVTLLTDHRTPTKCIESNWKSTRVSHSSAETNTERNFGNVHVPIYDVRYASSFGFADYRSPFAAFPQHISSMFKGPDLFTQSLRKYPTDGSSAEFIQRIIDYTRSRKSAKKHYPKCLRSLLRKTISQTQAANNYKCSNETNERKRRPVLDKDLSQNELVNYTYDYLKSSSGVPRDADVRYLTEMKRAIQGKLRCMVDDEPMTT